MTHNQQVSANITRLKEKIEAATSQHDLVATIRSLEHHPGPLDYKDKPWQVIGLLFMGLGGLALYSVFSRSLPYEFDYFLSVVLFYSQYWLPVAIVVFWQLWREEKGKAGFLSRYFKTPQQRMAVAAGIPMIVVLMPFWGLVYWEGLQILTLLVSGGGFASYELGLPLLLLVTGGIVCWRLYQRKHWRRPLSERISLLDILFNNGLKALPFNGKEKAKELGQQFKEFIRGNDLREIQHLYQGHYEGELHRFDYRLYRFHYVVRRSETYTDSKGNTRTRVVRNSYYRHGLLLHFPFSRGLSLNAGSGISFSGEKYTTASNEFNRVFSVRADEEIVAARFLSPAVIEAMLAMAAEYSRPVLEINAGGDLCFAFSNDDILEHKRTYNLESPVEFASEIAKHDELEKLNGLLFQIHNLMRLTDNNFQL
ncbi:DUF3137 domain-containing protein [Thalassolituus alkanivorans]|uniref:DUF3137 domain-containing protein n=1 Tax=Thalassolituus alkanivorans TaxID=2881055 RepID=UPI001E5F1A16|nr:DUF3137 domain-containing protein [Thalassolituus alkanivorans]MCB2384927.1 DUF3137 domain-containing protein [Thalassolituus alkanivorans]MCB2424824.1 DUF3137 domain-containing protein [Thalassolituus alkanivorans]